MFRKKTVFLILIGIYMVTLTMGSTGCGDKEKEILQENSTVGIQVVENREDTTGEIIQPGTTPDETKLFKPVFTDEKARNSLSVEYKPVTYEKKVKSYKVENNLSNIANLSQFGGFTQLQKEMLSQNSFVAMPSDAQQLFYIYENNSYLKLPSFVTVDSVLQVYHIFFDYSLRTLEAEKLLGAVEQLTDNMLSKSIYLYNTLKDTEVKKEALTNVAYFTIAQLSLEKPLPSDIPVEAKELAEKEFALVCEQGGFRDSPIFQFKLDYSQYKPRGHYTRNHDFERFFKAMMWYGQVPFGLYGKKDGTLTPDYKATTRALLMTYSIFLDDGHGSDIDLWENIYDPTVFYVGEADDLTVYQMKNLLVKVYGIEPDPDQFMQKELLNQLYNEAEKLSEPQIQAKWVTKNTPTSKQFRFMGQRYIPDSEILQGVVDPDDRAMPSGLDVMGVLGSDRAYDLLINQDHVDQQWPEYLQVFDRLRNKFSNLSTGKWQSNMYYGWMWELRSLLTPFGEGYPSFMTNTAWEDKSLNTALGSWSELRHDTILYAKQSGAECGGDSPPEIVKSYVEPNVEAYEKLLWLTQYSRINLDNRKMLPEDLKNKMQRFEDLLQFLIGCSVKELKNEELTPEEYNTLLTFGGSLENLTSSLVENGARWFEITSETDKNMALIADVHTTPGAYLEAGVGHADQIFVVVPIGGRLYLTRGAIFSYYEFVSDIRLTDEEWQKQIEEKKQPSRPEWTESFTQGEKEEIPVPTQPYNSGC